MWFAVWPGVVTASMRPAVAGDHLAILERHIGPEVAVGAGIERIVLADMQWPRGAVRPFGIDRRAGRCLDRGHRRRVVAMGVGDENVRHGFATHGIE